MLKNHCRLFIKFCSMY